MGRKAGPRHGTMQFWPRKRANKFLPRVNWNPLIEKREETGLLGFICYKVGMKSACVKDSTPNSMTKNKKIIVPVTIVECPTMKIYSVRFYKDKKPLIDVLNDNIDKELKGKLKLPGQSKIKTEIERIEKEDKYDDVSVIAYSQVKKTSVKKTPDITEIGLSGKTKQEKLSWIKERLVKEISISDVLSAKEKVVDIRGITIGKGVQGAVKRFGVKLRFHKTEKGQRRVGSIGPWHPSRLTYRVPLPGQMGFFNRMIYNNFIIKKGDIKEDNINPKSGFKKYGEIKNEYLILKGSLQGPSKRQLMLTKSLRPTKRQIRFQYELVELR